MEDLNKIDCLLDNIPEYCPWGDFMCVNEPTCTKECCTKEGDKNCDKFRSCAYCTMNQVLTRESQMVELTQREKDIIGLALNCLAQFSYSYSLFEEDSNLTITPQEISSLVLKVCGNNTSKELEKNN